MQARGGGTLPVVTAVFHETLGIGTLCFALTMPEEDVRAPNEFFRLPSLSAGLRAWPLTLTERGGFPPAAFRASV